MKYACSAPAMGMTRRVSLSPKRRSTRSAWRSSASMDRSSGVFLSSISPPQEQKQVGMYRVSSFTKAGEVQSQAV